MPHVTFIHGIANKPDAKALHEIWLQALASGGGPDLEKAKVTSSMVYWADVLYEEPKRAVTGLEAEGLESVSRGEEAAPDLQWRGELKGDEARLIEALASRLEVDRKVDDSEAFPHAEQVSGLEAVPLPWFAKRPLMKLLLRDVHHYLFNAKHSPRDGVTYNVQDEIRTRFVEALKQAPPGPHIVVSHSMGTVIAYDCLKRVPGCPEVDGLITIGSPLGLDEIQQMMVPEWSREDGFPSNNLSGNVDPWVNVFDRLDPVAGFDPEIANDYRRGHDELVKDIPESNSGLWRHDLTNYMRGQKLRKELTRMIGEGDADQS